MSAVAVPRGVPIAAVIVGLGAGVGWAVAGPEAALGWTLGIVATSLSMVGNWLITRLCGNLARYRAAPSAGTFMPVLGLFLKFPLYLLLGLWVIGLGTGGMVSFLIALGLVYLGLIGWALAQG